MKKFLVYSDGHAEPMPYGAVEKHYTDNGVRIVEAHDKKHAEEIAAAPLVEETAPEVPEQEEVMKEEHE